MHGLVPHLLFGGDVHRRFAALAVVAGAGAGIYDLAGARRIVARRRVGRGGVAFVVTVPALAVLVLFVSVLAVGLTVAVLAPTVLVSGGIGRVVGVVVIAVWRRPVGRRNAGGTGRWPSRSCWRSSIHNRPRTLRPS